MNCPLDGTTLLMSERSGIEIDYCPQCRGVWLDRGELDKILDREQQAATAPAYDDRDDRDDRRDDRDGYDRARDEYYSRQPYQKRRKRGGFLGDLFEGFGD